MRRPAGARLQLLRAALLDGDEALAAWSAWRAAVGVDAADWASQRLFPLVHSNLRRLGSDDPELERLKGMYRYSWYRNQLLFRRVGETIVELLAAGIETAALKGIALSVLHYRDLGLRPMEDADLLVRPADARAAVELLLGSGWTPLEPVPGMLEVKHAHPFRHEDGSRLDLHWNLLWEAAPDDGLWARSVPLAVAGAETRALDPTDQLLHVCVHGAQWDPTPSIRWVADAVVVLRGSTVDWDRLLVEAASRRVTLGLESCLRFLRDELAVDVPGQMLDVLAAAPHPVYERVGHRAKSWRGGLSRRTVLNWDRYRRLAVHYPEYSRVGFVGFSCQFAGLERRRQLPAAALRYAVAHWRARLR